MLGHFRSWPSLGLLLLGAAKDTLATKNHHEHKDETTVVTTVFSTTTVPVTCYVNVTVPHYVDITIPNYVNTTLISTVTKIVSEYITESTTATLHYTTAITDTETDTVTETTAVTETETDSTSTTDTLYYTVSTTETDSATVTNTATETTTETDTDTTTTTVPATITTYTTQTIFSTTYDPCPKSCSISAETVNLYFWPTDRPYTYPSTHVDEKLGYTFVSPSVYMLIPTAVGVNTASQTTGPSTSQWILALDLEEVSTIDGTATKQLTLSHLRTDCPKTADPTAIASLVDPACNPILAAPKQVSSWAYPCNACGRFGLFDPPYAVPPVTGLIATTTTVVDPVGTSTPVTSSVVISIPSSEAPSLPVITVTTPTQPEPEPPTTSAPSTGLPSFSESLLPTTAPVTAAAAPVLVGPMLFMSIGIMLATMLLL